MLARHITARLIKYTPVAYQKNNPSSNETLEMFLLYIYIYIYIYIYREKCVCVWGGGGGGWGVGGLDTSHYCDIMCVLSFLYQEGALSRLLRRDSKAKPEVTLKAVTKYVLFIRRSHKRTSRGGVGGWDRMLEQISYSGIN